MLDMAFPFHVVALSYLQVGEINLPQGNADAIINQDWAEWKYLGNI